MERMPNDNKIMDLLGKLKNSDVSYPPDILAARRQHYLKQIANIGLGMGVSAGIKNTAKGGNGTAIAATLASKILETILVAAIAVEASTAAYIYRNKIADVFKPHISSSNAHEITHPSKNISSSNSKFVEATETPFVTVTTIASSTTTPQATLSDTPSSRIAGSNNDNNSGTNVNANSTPSPNGNNGNHYGQTPKPERTKDNNKGGNNNNNGSNNKHHNDGNGHNGGGNGNNNGGGNGNHHGGNNKP